MLGSIVVIRKGLRVFLLWLLPDFQPTLAIILYGVYLPSAHNFFIICNFLESHFTKRARTLACWKWINVEHWFKWSWSIEFNFCLMVYAFLHVLNYIPILHKYKMNKIHVCKIPFCFLPPLAINVWSKHLVIRP